MYRDLRNSCPLPPALPCPAVTWPYSTNGLVISGGCREDSEMAEPINLLLKSVVNGPSTDFIQELVSSITQSCPTFCDPMTAAHQASLSITNSQSLLKPMSIELVMPSNHLILCHPLLLPHSIFSRIRVFSRESVLCIRWPKFQLQHQSFQCIFRTDCLQD